MRTEQPRVIHLKDYRVPDYLIDETHLNFELFEDHSLVQARLVMRRNPAAKDHALPPLVLDGQQLELLELSLDGQILDAADYQLDDHHLTLQPKAEHFVLESRVRIHPEQNTALEGLYKSGKMFCTQCEAEGFRKITFYLDRPDVLSRFTTRVEADQARYPVLLSNGNPIDAGSAANGRHWATWQDPFKKPSYLFALVAGNLEYLEDSFTTLSGRKVTLRIFVAPQNLDKCQYAMTSLKKAMAWDERTYGREYDLDIFMIVAVDDFNMGAMENKGLNIFNTNAVLAEAHTATDAAHQRVEGVVAHEYFHNWSGDRVTCRDWFQLSLKEGFTVFRDAEFSADMNSRTVKRIQDVAFLRTNQFAEDDGPMAHPVRPDSFIEISNFYTLTVYEKGAEVVRMIRTLVGDEGFRCGSDLYFERHDGQAVTCDDFVKAMEDANGVDLTQFRRWYSQAGTPRLKVSEAYDAASQRYSLTFTQSTPVTPGQTEKLPFVIPVDLALLDANGQELPLRLQGESGAVTGSRVLRVTEAHQSFSFEGLAQKPVPSLLRGFSAPVKLSFPYDRDQLLFLMRHDSDGFNRWDAGNQLAVQALQDLIGQYQVGQPLQLDERLPKAFAELLADESLDQALLAEMLSLPSEAYLTELADVADTEAIHAARQAARKSLASSLGDALWQRYQANRQLSRQQPYQAEAGQFARRALQNTALSYLAFTDSSEVLAACVEQFEQADNMTERLAALVVLVNSSHDAERQRALAAFAEQFKDDPLVMNQWLSVQAASLQPGALARVKKLMEHPAFTLKNPNKVRAVIGVFANQNLVNFHNADGAGYAFLTDQVITLNRLNPQIAARQLAPLTRWRKYDEKRQQLMRAELERILVSGPLSSDVYEVASKSLA